MEFAPNCHRVAALVNRSVAERSGIARALVTHGLSAITLASGRTTVLEPKRGALPFLSQGNVLAADPADVLTFCASAEAADRAMKFIAGRAALSEPGHGTVTVEEIQILKAHPLCAENNVFTGDVPDIRVYKELSGIACIVQRGQGDDIARVALDTGTCVPGVFFGIGTGLRDKLGLLRITIPAEKEVIFLVTSSFDADGVLDLLIEAGQLDQPGRGFIFKFPILAGIVDTRVDRGAQKQAASLEQIVAAVDELKGGVAWRRKSISKDDSGANSRAFLTDLLDFVFICDEGRASDLVAVAMAAGAGGATISRGRHLGVEGVSPAREISSMIVPAAQVNSILTALDGSGAFSDRAHGIAFLRRVPKACTYLAKK